MSISPRSILQPIPRPEYPGNHQQAKHQKAAGHQETDEHTDIGGAIEAPAKAADQVHTMGLNRPNVKVRPTSGSMLIE
jgi:hypothetical protein